MAGTMVNDSPNSSTGCFDSARNYLDRFEYRIGYGSHHIAVLKMGISLLETFDLYIRKCRRRRRRSKRGTCLEKDEDKDDAKSDRLSSISFRIQDLVWGIRRRLDCGASDHRGIKCELNKIGENINLFFETDIKELDIISLLLYYSLEDLQLVMDFTDSISVNLKRLSSYCKFHAYEALRTVLETLQEKLMFLKSFARFATLQRVEGQPLIDLLGHVEVVAVNAVSLAFTFWFQRRNEKVRDEMQFEISQLIHKMIDPVDPQVREIYTHVLEASKLSKSSDTLAVKENRHLLVEFIDYLLQSIMGIISECYTSFLDAVKDQMLKLIEGVRFLSVLLSLEQGKFDELNDAMIDLIGVAVSDAGIVTFSLSANEMKEGLCKDTDLALSNLLQELQLIIAEAAHVYPLTSSSSLSFPRTKELGSLDFLLETLEELVSSTADSIAFPNDQIRTILEDLVFLRFVLGNIVEQCNRDEKLQALWSRIMKVAYSAELKIDSALLGDKCEPCLDAVARDVHLMKIEAEEVYGCIRYDGETQRVTKTTINMPSQVTAPISTEALVGLNDEVESIIDRLVRGSRQLDIIAIVGMPGLGKTTLANTIYSDPTVECHFHIRAWCCFSQAYTKHSLLVQILCSIDCESHIQYLDNNEDDMADKLRKLLKRNRYLIVLDDVWDIVGWDSLKHSLPDDCNGSRILLTSRFQKLSLLIKPDSEPHHLRPLTDNESCELLQKKLFAKKDCPPTFSKVVLNIAKYCKGLPLAVVLVAGILAITKQDCWEEVVRHLTSSIYVDNEHCMKTLEQSYNYLPDYLKPCLLYFGAFQEDRDIPVRKLLCLWISEGFVQKTEGKSLEDVADDYLMDLIGRSLVMAAQQRSLGGIKTCRIHDLVHEFCVKKAKEERFLQILHGDNLLTFTGPCDPHRLVVYPSTRRGPKKSRLFFPHLCSLLFSDCTYTELDIISRKVLSSKLLRVLDCRNDPWSRADFPSEVVFLVHLRYLNITSDRGEIPSAIANLSRLETFVVGGPLTSYFLPNTIWNIKTLRHLVVSASLGGFIFPINSLEGSPDLEHLDTLTLSIWNPSRDLQKILTKLPSIRRLRCVGDSNGASAGILVLDYLSRLESLKMRFLIGYEFEFPLNLRKLTLIDNNQPWSIISAIGKLHNLVVLKLCRVSFLGKKWEMEEGEFSNLRFLKLSGLNIRCWTASSDNFSCLEKLVLHQCYDLEEVPSCLGETLTLGMIEVKLCHESTVNSVKQIQQEQIDLGNKGLKIIIKQEIG
nr:putative late blight resistance protein homolog R1A-3 [Coffea arabica]XP_027073935.1 putative late blight resistance protein homolog R1A-3 [Coffea arabica]XP_027073936.1 putative late blight resistance protein homolog R1A-3 [Coffea arabica]XP_027073937.1 putative late blight resistance protein homolog R1A-3 [Coffea arabica]XP_027073939.1 putative late blight resistance protein homolog R1A-3 [Coffea arabica]